MAKALAHGQRPPLQTPWRFCAGQLAEIRPDLPVEDVLAQAVQRGGQTMHLQWARALPPPPNPPAAAASHMIQMGVRNTWSIAAISASDSEPRPVPASINACAPSFRQVVCRAPPMPPSQPRTVSFMQGIFRVSVYHAPHGIQRVPVLCGGCRAGKTDAPPQGQGLQVDGLGVLRGQKRTANQTGLIACSAHPVGGGAHGAEWREPHAEARI